MIQILFTAQAEKQIAKLDRNSRPDDFSAGHADSWLTLPADRVSPTFTYSFFEKSSWFLG